MSKIIVDSIEPRPGINTITINAVNIDSSSSFVVTGIITASGFSGSLNASQLSSGTVPNARFPATLPAASGANLTSLNASNLGSGTIPDARFPSALPAIDGSNLTGIDSGDLLQVVHYDFSATTTGTIGVGTITPTSSSNKVLVLLACSMYGWRASNRGTTVRLALERPDTNQIYNIQEAWDQNGATDTSNWHQFSVAGHYLDSPGSTSAQTYYCKFTASHTGSANSTMMTLIEVKGV